MSLVTYGLSNLAADVRPGAQVNDLAGMPLKTCRLNTLGAYRVFNLARR